MRPVLKRVAWPVLAPAGYKDVVSNRPATERVGHQGETMRIKLVPLLLLLPLALTARPAVAQTEAALRAYFEGKSITVKVEMPGSDDGVDVYPGKPQPIDFRK